MYNTDALTAGLWARCASEQHGDACLEFVRITSPETKRAAPGWAKWKFSPLSHHTWSSSFCFFPASNFPACLMVVGGDKHVCFGNRRTGALLESEETLRPTPVTRCLFHDDGGFTIRRRPHRQSGLSRTIPTTVHTQRDKHVSSSRHRRWLDVGLARPWSPILHGICTRMEAPSVWPMLGLFPGAVLFSFGDTAYFPDGHSVMDIP